MTTVQIFQLYAPLAGLVALAFWSGVLSNRVFTLEKDSAAMKTELAKPDLNGERLVRVETKLEGMKESLDAMERGMQGIQRQIANSMKGPN